MSSPSRFSSSWMTSFSSDLESALDNVGFSYLDGIPIKIHEDYIVPFDLTEINKVLNKDFEFNLQFFDYDWNLEKKIMSAFKEETEKREMKRREEEEEEKKWNRFKNGVNRKEISQIPIPSLVSSSVLPTPLTENPPKINYSDFEGETDPFDSAELQSIDDYKVLKELFHPPNPLPPNDQIPPDRCKSYNDIPYELQKEKDNDPKTKVGVERPLTPPPPSSNSDSNLLKNWIPWPSPDFNKDPPESPNLQNRQLVSQLSEMGFNVSRIIKGGETLGYESCTLISFCLLVDKFVDEGYPISESETVLLLRNLNETETRSHLQAFMKLKALGFTESHIHASLVNDLDYDKALENLLN